MSTANLAVIDPNGVAIDDGSFDNTASGFVEVIDLLTSHSVKIVGVEGSGKWGSQVSVALHAATFDVREVPPHRSATQRKIRRLDKTDTVDAFCTGCAVLADPGLGPAQVLEISDPVVAEIEAVLEHRKILVDSRALTLQQVADQISKLPIDICDQLDSGRIESKLRALENVVVDDCSTSSGVYRLSWLVPYIERDKALRRQIRALERKLAVMLDTHGTTLRDEDGIGPVTAATLLCQVGDPNSHLDGP